MRNRMLRNRVLGISVLCVIGAASTAWAFDVQGTFTLREKVKLPAFSEAADARSHFWDEPNGITPEREIEVPSHSEITLVLVGEGEPLADAAPYRLASGSLAPSTIVGRANSELKIENTNPLTHELFADDEPGFAALGTGAGGTRSIQLAAAGEHRIHDRLWPHVQGFLVVLPNYLAHATLEANNSFVFRGVNPGTYQLKAYYLGREIKSMDITVAEANLVVPASSLDLPTP